MPCAPDLRIVRQLHATQPLAQPSLDALHDTIRLMSSMHSNRDLATLRWPAVVAQTPYAKKLAKDLGVDLAAIAGSGPAGRITASDVEAARNGAGPASPGASDAFGPLHLYLPPAMAYVCCWHED